MSLTQPRLAYYLTITGGTGPHLTINYTDLSFESVSLGAGTYYVQGDGSSSDLIQEVEDALNTNASSVTFTVAVTTSPLGEVLITATGAKTVDTIDFITSQIYPMDLGYALTTSTTQIGFAASPNIALSTYRVPSAWYPSAVVTTEEPTRMDKAVGQFGDDGLGVVDVYVGHVRRRISIVEVYAAVVREEYVSDAGHVANVSGLESGDTNAPLESWLVRLQDLLGGTVPTLRWTPDISSPSTYRSVRITDVDLYGSVSAWISETNDAPLFYDLEFELSEVPS